MEIHSECFTLISRIDQLAIHGIEMWPDTGVVGVVQLAHGMAEHKERYEPFMRALCKCGYACAISDHRGHGKSVRHSDELGHFYAPDGAAALVDDLTLVTDRLSGRYAGKPLYLMGHSMGSLAVRVYARQADERLSGLIVCGCPSQNAFAGAAILLCRVLSLFRGGRYKSALINKMLLGGFNDRVKDAQTPCDWLCTNRQTVSDYQADPLCGFPFTLNGCEALLTLMTRAYQRKGWRVKNPNLPILFISGAEDPCMVSRKKLCQAASLLVEAGYTNVSVRLYPSMRHEILNETGREAVYADAAAFLDAARKEKARLRLD